MLRRVIGYGDGLLRRHRIASDVRTSFLDSIHQDLKFALRALRRSPGFTFVAILVLALGIAANTTIFSIVNAVLFRPLPVPGARNLQFLSVVFSERSDVLHPVPYSTFQQIASRRDVFAGVAGYLPESAKIGSGIAAIRAAGERVTTDYFDALQVQPGLGRTFVPSDDQPGATPSIIVSDRFWRTRLDANPHVLGTTIDLRPVSFIEYFSGYHTAYTVVGVMPPGFDGLSSAWVPAEYWVPLRQRTIDAVAGDNAERRFYGSAEQQLEGRGIKIVARLKPGATEAAVRAAVLPAERAMHEYRIGGRIEKGRIVSGGADRSLLPFDARGNVQPNRLALALMIVSGMVLIIAAANLAGILMARGITRRGEIGVRLALGASRARVARHLLTEAVLVSSVSAIGALAFSRLFIDLFLLWMPARIGSQPSALKAISLDVPIDLTVLMFTMLLAIVAGVLVGLTPALQAWRTDVVASISGGSTVGSATVRWRVRRWIVVPQVCLSVVLLLAAAVLVRALLQTEFADRGFDAGSVVYADIAQPAPNWESMTSEKRRAEDARRSSVYNELLEQVAALPTVERAALATKSSWNGDRWGGSSVVKREAYGRGQNHWVSSGEVSVGYFEAMGIPILRGRPFNTRDTSTSTPVAIVCERLAELLWPGRDPIGDYIANFDPAHEQGTPTWLLVVGVAKEVKVPGREDRPTRFFYMPLEQRRWDPFSPPSILVRGRGQSRDLLKTVTRRIAAVHPEVEIPRARTMDEEIGEVLYPRRLGAALLALSGLFGLLLATIGLYGVVSYSAAQRLREIGVRTALGARRRDILSLLLRDALRTLAVAVACGIALGYAAVRVVSRVVVALPTLDMLTLVLVPAVLSIVIIAACVLPARRAAGVDPVEVLRAQ